MLPSRSQGSQSCYPWVSNIFLLGVILAEKWQEHFDRDALVTYLEKKLCSFPFMKMVFFFLFWCEPPRRRHTSKSEWEKEKNRPEF